MIVINTPLRAELFQKAAEEEGLIFVKNWRLSTSRFFLNRAMEKKRA